MLPAVVNINTERVVRRTVRDPFEDFYAQFFGYNRVRPRQIRQTLQSLGSGFIIDPAGYIVTNQHVVERAADLKIHVTTNDGKTYNAHYIAGDDKTDLAFIKIDAQNRISFHQPRQHFSELAWPDSDCGRQRCRLRQFDQPRRS